MTKLGVNTFIWSANFDYAVALKLPAIKDHGFDGVEVPLFRPTRFSCARRFADLESNGTRANRMLRSGGGLSLISEEHRSVSRLSRI